MPDHNFVAAPFADGHIAAASVSASIAPIVVVAIIIATFAFPVDSVSVAAVGSDADVQLSKRDFRFGRDGITFVSGGCRKSPQCARDASDKQ
jgi:hypothetical protein